ncbi:MAG: hypothetical protein ACREAG_07695 [Nitrosopumilaceae archaeon]
MTKTPVKPDELLYEQGAYYVRGFIERFDTYEGAKWFCKYHGIDSKNISQNTPWRANTPKLYED